MSSGNSCITYRNAPEDPCNVTFITKYGSCVSHFKHFLLALSSKSVGEISQIQRSHQALKDNPPVKSASWSQWKPGGVEARLSACSCMYDWKTGACTRKEAEATFKAALLCDYQQAMADDDDMETVEEDYPELKSRWNTLARQVLGSRITPYRASHTAS